MEIDKEELQWQQRFRANWLRYGDRNTKYFHSFDNYRRKLNTIKALWDGNGNLKEEELDKLNIAVHYFKDIFASSGCTDVDEIYDGVESRVTPNLNRLLTTKFTESEIHSTMKDLGLIKASGYDGFPMIFYQRFLAVGW